MGAAVAEATPEGIRGGAWPCITAAPLQVAKPEEGAVAVLNPEVPATAPLAVLKPESTGICCMGCSVAIGGGGIGCCAIGCGWPPPSVDMPPRVEVPEGATGAGGEPCDMTPLAPSKWNAWANAVVSRGTSGRGTILRRPTPASCWWLPSYWTVYLPSGSWHTMHPRAQPPALCQTETHLPGGSPPGATAAKASSAALAAAVTEEIAGEASGANSAPMAWEPGDNCGEAELCAAGCGTSEARAAPPLL
mmetsp:Transcript_65088/g.190926  ORF Transcript_65088/g.190926 Transcript_65088/m.190926 type:complete len:248 (+) Transcript_65088:206-949(+)